MWWSSMLGFGSQPLKVPRKDLYSIRVMRFRKPFLRISSEACTTSIQLVESPAHWGTRSKKTEKQLLTSSTHLRNETCQQTDPRSNNPLDAYSDHNDRVPSGRMRASDWWPTRPY